MFDGTSRTTTHREGRLLALSAAGGTNIVAAGARTVVWGADAKVKLWNSPQSYLLLQAEATRLRRDEAGWDPAFLHGEGLASRGRAALPFVRTEIVVSLLASVTWDLPGGAQHSS